MLVGIGLASSVSISVETFNYLDFFPSLGRLTLHIESLTPSPLGTGIEYRIVFFLENPSRYQGLGVKGFGSVLEIHSKNETVLIPYGSIHADASGPLPPYSDLRVLGDFEILDRNAVLLQSLLEGQGADFHFESTLLLHTFLEPSFGLALLFRCISDGQPATCDTVSTDITAYGSGPVGGGV